MLSDVGFDELECHPVTEEVEEDVMSDKDIEWEDDEEAAGMNEADRIQNEASRYRKRRKPQLQPTPAPPIKKKRTPTFSIDDIHRCVSRCKDDLSTGLEFAKNANAQCDNDGLQALVKSIVPKKFSSYVRYANYYEFKQYFDHISTFQYITVMSTP